MAAYVEKSMSRLIPLKKDKFSIIDETDFEYLSQWNWTCSYNGYAWRRISLGYPNGKRKRAIVFMHRAIMNPAADMQVDHINGDKLDNRRCNLRICTQSQNLANMISVTGTSKYKGVYWSSTQKKWVAQIVLDKKAKYLGCFDSEEAAASCYDLAAYMNFGEFAKVNTL